jgi:hypothetical protein
LQKARSILNALFFIEQMFVRWTPRPLCAEIGKPNLAALRI